MEETVNSNPVKQKMLQTARKGDEKNRLEFSNEEFIGYFN